MIWLHDWRDRVADCDINDVAIFAPKMNKVFLKLCDLGFGVNTPLTEQQNSHLPELFQTRALEKWHYINNVMMVMLQNFPGKLKAGNTWNESSDGFTGHK